MDLRNEGSLERKLYGDLFYNEFLDNCQEVSSYLALKNISLVATIDSVSITYPADYDFSNSNSEYSFNLPYLLIEEKLLHREKEPFTEIEEKMLRDFYKKLNETKKPRDLVFSDLKILGYYEENGCLKIHYILK